MSLRQARVRRISTAFGIVTVMAAGGVVAAESAQAASTLTVSATSATTLNFGTQVSSGSLAAALANGTFALQVSTAITADSLQLVLDDSPSGGKLYYDKAVRSADNGPTAGWGWVNSSAPSTTNQISRTDAAADNLFLTADVPGTYKFHLVDAGASAGTDDDVSSSTITLTVKDIYANPSSTTDDWVAAVHTPSSASIGAPVAATASLSPLTLTDIRGSNSGTGVLATKLAALVKIGFAGAGVSGDIPVVGVLSNGAVTRTLATGTTTSATPNVLTATASVDSHVVGSSTTTVTDNLVGSVALAAAEATGTVKQPSSSTVAVKTGTVAVTYTATVDVFSGSKAGKTVYFTLGGSAFTGGKLSTDGTTVSASSGIYSAQTDSDGVAKLKVTSSDTAAAVTYTVAAASNAHPASPSLTATYAAPVASSAVLTNTDAQLTPVVGSSVTLTGKLLDQFGGAYVPSSSQNQQIVLSGGAAANVPVSSGTFSYTYTPSTTPTAGASNSFTFTYTTGGVPATVSVPATINWASAASPSAVTMAGPVDASTGVVLQSRNAPVDGVAVSGVVKDSSGAGLAYKSVTITGGAGVYFAAAAAPDSSHKLSTSATVLTDGSGNYGGVYAFFTKAGSNKVTATSGSVSTSSTVTTDASTDPYKVSVDNVAGISGSNLVISGAVKDAFGNPVAGKKVDLQVTGTLGALGSNTVSTNSEGVFSTTFASGSNANGTATITATLYNIAQSALTTGDPGPNAGWAAAGVTVAAGDYQDTGTLTVGDGTPTLASASVYGGYVTLKGTAPAGSSVDIYAKPAGSSAGLVWVASTKADANTGDWTRALRITSSTTYVARVNGHTSNELTARVSSAPATKTTSVNFSAKSLGKGRVQLAVQGNPRTSGTIALYVKSGSSWKLVKTFKSTSSGAGSIKVTTGKGSKAIKVSFAVGGYKTGSKTSTIKVK